MTLATRDLYRLRKANLEAQKAFLRAQTVQQTLREITLELERKYGLLGLEATVDIHTGKIRMHREPVESMTRGDEPDGPDTDADAGT